MSFTVMDPITHAVIGLAVSKMADSGSITDPSTIGALAGAVVPDLDILLQKWGDYVYLKNHRGATHSIPGLAMATAAIALLLKLFFPHADFGTLVLYTALGCLSHSLADVFNSYGAKLLWPVNEKKFSLKLLASFDPIVITSLAGYYFMHGTLQYISLALFAGYILFRSAMRYITKRKLARKFGVDFGRISLLPSVTGYFRWHFVLEGEDNNIIGVKYFFTGRVKILEVLKKAEEESIGKALNSPVGLFFKDFTPLTHVAVEKAGEITRYIFTDMRYYIRNNFLHHAVLEIDNKKGTVLETFNPYSMSRSSSIEH